MARILYRKYVCLKEAGEQVLIDAIKFIPSSYCMVGNKSRMLTSSRKQDVLRSGILNTWIGNEADIRLNYGIPNFHPCCA